ncbi:MAG: TIGR04053 family radical SAM/SPASM domain-containing protein [Dehalococcoidia bacterium]
MTSPPAALARFPGNETAPFTIAWEITRACALACVHCRADAQVRRDPDELSTAEGVGLIDQAAEMGTVVFVVTGGDPLMREDCFALISHARDRGMQVGFSPSATGRLTREAIRRARDAGAHRLHLSLDGASAETHDRFRGVRGSFDRTMRAMTDAAEAGPPLQVGTTVTRTNVDELEAIAGVVERAGAVMWSVFFLVPTGRGQATDMLDAEGHEQVMRWLASLRGTVPFDVRTTAGPQFRRIVAQEARERGRPPLPASPAAGPRHLMRVNDGDGFCFVSHTGDVCPSGFLPVAAGNVRETSLASIYRDSALFRRLRDRAQLKGKCRGCEYTDVCGGSRARAWALTGDELAEDPTCAYIPRSEVGRAYA